MQSAVETISGPGHALNFDRFVQINRNGLGQFCLKFCKIQTHSVASYQNGSFKCNGGGLFLKSIGIRNNLLRIFLIAMKYENSASYNNDQENQHQERENFFQSQDPFTTYSTIKSLTYVSIL